MAPMRRTRELVWVVLVAACLGASAGCTERREEPVESSAAECGNDFDEDSDGLVDCADPGCAVHAMCAASGADAGPTPTVDAGPRPDARVGPSCGEPLDVVFVIDVSTSMAEEADALRLGVESVWNAAQGLTTNTQFGLVVFVDDALGVGGCAPFPTVTTLQQELLRWRDHCATNASPVSDTSNSDCAENSLDALWLAATSCPWREGATRVLIHVTDDTFAERPTRLSDFGGSGVAVQHTYAEVSDALFSRQIRVGAFAAPGAGEECGAGASSNVGQGFHEPYLGMPSLPERTDGRAWSIREVRAGTLDMSAAITDLIADEYCTLF